VQPSRCHLVSEPLDVYFFISKLFILRGTKGDNGAAKDLGGAKKVKGENGKDMMEVELPTAGEDVDQLWAASRAALKIKPPAQKEKRDSQTKQADHDRNSRTNVVLAWIGTNL
jgi:chitin synthase